MNEDNDSNEPKELLGVKVEQLPEEKLDLHIEKEKEVTDVTHENKKELPSIPMEKIKEKKPIKKLPKPEVFEQPKKTNINLILVIACIVVAILILLAFLFEFHNKDFSTNVSVSTPVNVTLPDNNLNAYASVNNTYQNNFTINVDLGDTIIKEISCGIYNKLNLTNATNPC